MYTFLSTLTHVLFSRRPTTIRKKTRLYTAREQEALYVKAFLGYI